MESLFYRKETRLLCPQLKREQVWLLIQWNQREQRVKTSLGHKIWSLLELEVECSVEVTNQYLPPLVASFEA